MQRTPDNTIPVATVRAWLLRYKRWLGQQLAETEKLLKELDAPTPEAGSK